MLIDIQRLRNLTTGLLHTDIGCVYEDLGMITGEGGLMTHMLPRAMIAVQPWLRKYVTEERFWNECYDVTHVGEFTLPESTYEERCRMLRFYKSLTDSMIGKQRISVLLSENDEDATQ